VALSPSVARLNTHVLGLTELNEVDLLCQPRRQGVTGRTDLARRFYEAKSLLQQLRCLICRAGPGLQGYPRWLPYVAAFGSPEAHEPQRYSADLAFKLHKRQAIAEQPVEIASLIR